MQCLETPTTGEPDIDLFYADEATGTEDAAVSGLSNQVSVLAAAADWTIAANVNMRPLSAIVAADM